MEAKSVERSTATMTLLDTGNSVSRRALPRQRGPPQENTPKQDLRASLPPFGPVYFRTEPLLVS